jgi:hypothetical protein
MAVKPAGRKTEDNHDKEKNNNGHTCVFYFTDMCLW